MGLVLGIKNTDTSKSVHFSDIFFKSTTRLLLATKVNTASFFLHDFYSQNENCYEILALIG